MKLSLQRKVNYKSVCEQRKNMIREEHLHMLDSITYEMFLLLYKKYSDTSMSEVEFARYFLDIDWKSWYNLQTGRRSTTSILEREPYEDSEFDIIKQRVIKKEGLSSKKGINYERLVELHQKYGDRFSLKMFAYEVLSLNAHAVDDMHGKRESERRILKEFPQTREQIMKIKADVVANAGLHMGQELTLAQFEEIYGKYKDYGIEDKDFAFRILGVAEDTFRKFKNGKRKVITIFNSYPVFPEDLIALREKVIVEENLYIEQPISNERFKVLYEKYAGILSEELFAVEILDISIDAVRNANRRNDENHILTGIEISEDYIKELRRKIATEKRLRHNQERSKVQIKRLRDEFAPRLSERIFGTSIMGINAWNFSKLQAGNRKTCYIWADEAPSTIEEIQEIRQKVIKECNLHYNEKMSYKRLHRIHIKYAPTMRESAFARDVLDINQSQLDNLRNDKENSYTHVLLNEQLPTEEEIRQIKLDLIRKKKLHRKDSLDYKTFKLWYKEFGGIMPENMFAARVLDVQPESLRRIKPPENIKKRKSSKRNIEQEKTKIKTTPILLRTRMSEEYVQKLKEKIIKENQLYPKMEISLPKLMSIYRKYNHILSLIEFSNQILGIDRQSLKLLCNGINKNIRILFDKKNQERIKKGFTKQQLEVFREDLKNNIPDKELAVCYQMPLSFIKKQRREEKAVQQIRHSILKKYKLYPGVSITLEKIMNIYSKYECKYSLDEFCEKILGINNKKLKSLQNEKIEDVQILFDVQNKNRFKKGFSQNDIEQLRELLKCKKTEIDMAIFFEMPLATVQKQIKEEEKNQKFRMEYKIYPGVVVSLEQIDALYKKYAKKYSLQEFCFRYLGIDENTLNELLNGEIDEINLYSDEKNKKRIAKGFSNEQLDVFREMLENKKTEEELAVIFQMPLVVIKRQIKYERKVNKLKNKIAIQYNLYPGKRISLEEINNIYNEYKEFLSFQELFEKVLEIRKRTIKSLEKGKSKNVKVFYNRKTQERIKNGLSQDQLEELRKQLGNKTSEELAVIFQMPLSFIEKERKKEQKIERLKKQILIKYNLYPGVMLTTKKIKDIYSKHEQGLGFYEFCLRVLNIDIRELNKINEGITNEVRILYDVESRERIKKGLSKEQLDELRKKIGNKTSEELAVIFQMPLSFIEKERKKERKIKQLRKQLPQKYRLYPGKKVTLNEIETLHINHGKEFSLLEFCMRVLEIDDEFFEEFCEGKHSKISVLFNNRNRKRIASGFTKEQLKKFRKCIKSKMSVEELAIKFQMPVPFIRYHLQKEREEQNEWKAVLIKNKLYPGLHVSLDRIIKLYSKHGGDWDFKAFCLQQLGIRINDFERLSNGTIKKVMILCDKKNLKRISKGFSLQMLGEFNRYLNDKKSPEELAIIFQLPIEVINNQIKREKEKHGEDRSRQTFNTSKELKMEDTVVQIMYQGNACDKDINLIRTYIERCEESFRAGELTRERLDYFGDAINYIGAEIFHMEVFVKACMQLQEYAIGVRHLSQYIENNEGLNDTDRMKLTRMRDTIRYGAKKQKAVNMIARGESNVERICHMTGVLEVDVLEIINRMNAEKRRRVFPNGPADE